MAKTVANQFAESLAAAGVKRTYGIVGDSLNGLTDSIRRQGKILAGCKGARPVHNTEFSRIALDPNSQ
jgi:hypothetical protein